MFDPGKPFQSRLMLASKAGAYSSEAPERCDLLEKIPGLSCKILTKQETPPRDKHSTLLGAEEKGFLWAIFTTLYFLSNSLMSSKVFVLSKPFQPRLM